MAGSYTAKLYDELEREVISDIARRVSKTNRFTETAEIQAKSLRAQGYSPARIQSEVMKELNANNDYLQFVAENTRAYKQEVKEIIKQTVAQAAIDGDTLTAQAGEMAWNDDMQMWKEHGVDLKKDNTLRQIQKAYADQTVGQLKNITRTSAMQVGGVPILDAYHHELDLAVVKTASGAFSFQQSMEDCCRRLGQGGVQVVYPSGKKYSIEAAARMTMKTGISQLAGKVTEHNMQKTGADLVFVTAHAGARPSHAEWHGKVYSYSGKSKKYEDFYEATGYGTIEGLKGVNCTHNFYPHWEGDPIPEFKEPDPVTIDGKTYTMYEATQKQREMERSVRNMKREKAAAEAAGDDNKVKELNQKLTQTTKDYKAFSQSAGLRPKTERMRIFDDGNNNGNKGAKITPPTSAKAQTSKAAQDAVKAAGKTRFRIYNPTISEDTKRIAEGYAERINDKDKGKFERLINRSRFTNKDNGCYYDSVKDIINISEKDERDYTAFHEVIHKWDFGNPIDKKLTATYTIHYNSLGEYIGDYLWDDQKRKADYNIIDGLFGLEHGTTSEPVKKIQAMQAFTKLITDAGIKTTDVDLVHLSDFASALTWNSTMGFETYGGHETSYWTDQPNRMSEMLASYGILKSIGRDDMLQIEKKMAPNLFKIIEEEWKKKWI